LGPLNDKSTGQGIHAHSAFAVTEEGTPLGTLSSNFWVRDASAPELTETQKRALPIEARESFKWLRCAQQTSRALQPFLDNGGQAIQIGDRECDVIELFAQPRHLNFHLLVRSMHPRLVDLAHGRVALSVALDGVEDCGEYTVVVPAQRGRSSRVATMRMRFARVVLLPPADKKSKIEKQTVWAVRAWEINAPVDTDSLNWTLLSTLEVANFEQARQTVERYTRRWIIERLHYTLKTGVFNVEKMQFDDFHALANALAFYYVVAWQVLWLMYWSREHPDEPASSYLEPDELTILRRETGKPIATIMQAVRAIAQLAGYANYPKSPLPGVKMIWTGRRRLSDMIRGARLLACSSQDVTQA
jgi:hypothetical protein